MSGKKYTSDPRPDPDPIRVHLCTYVAARSKNIRLKLSKH